MDESDEEGLQEDENVDNDEIDGIDSENPALKGNFRFFYTPANEVCRGIFESPCR